MPNAYNKVRATNPFLKLEKEQENKVIRRKLNANGTVVTTTTVTTTTANKNNGPATTICRPSLGQSRRLERTVADNPWDRMGRGRKSASSDSSTTLLGTTRSQMNLLLQRRGSAHHVPLQLHLPQAIYAPNQMQPYAHIHHSHVHKQTQASTGSRKQAISTGAHGPVRKPVSPCTAVNAQTATAAATNTKTEATITTTTTKERPHKAAAGKRVRLRAGKRTGVRDSFLLFCAGKNNGSAVDRVMHEILTARSMCNSKSSSSKSKESSKSSKNSPNSTKDSLKSLKDSSKGSKDSLKSSKDSLQSSQNSKHSAETYSLSSPHLDYNEDDEEDILIKWHEFSQDSAEDYYETAELIPVPTTDSLIKGHSVSQRLQNALHHCNHTMAPDELDTIKQVVKTDERHRDLRHDDAELFREILKSQLHEILRQEMVVKSAICKLSSVPEYSGDADGYGIDVACSASLSTARTMDMLTSATGTIATTDGSDCEPQKPKVDVIFKNVPTLEKEIMILKALGEQLEATLKRTSPEAIERHKESGVQVVPTYCLWLVWLPENEQHAALSVPMLGVRLEHGVVCEFRIAKKTIVELKEHANKHFYLPIRGSGGGLGGGAAAIAVSERTELRRTSFRRLKEKPDILMQHLRAKSSRVTFNVLEQDPVFFNNLLLHHHQHQYYHQCQNQYSNQLAEVTPLKYLTDATSEDSNDSSGSANSSSNTLTSPLPSTFHSSSLTAATDLPATTDSLRAETESASDEQNEKTTMQDVATTVIAKPVRKFQLQPLPPTLPMVPLVLPKPPTRTMQWFDIPPEAPKSLIHPIPSITTTKNTSTTKLAVCKRQRLLAAKEEYQLLNTETAAAPPTRDPFDDSEIDIDIEWGNKRRELLKTLMVGTLHVSVFVFMIIALVLPDAQCGP